MRRISLLGSTGSIGCSTLDVIAAWPERFRCVALAAGRNVDRLLEQCRAVRPELVSVQDEADAARVREAFPGSGMTVLSGAAGLDAVASGAKADVVVSALVGAVGLGPTLRAIEAGIDVALANKEVLVCAGELVTRAAARSGAALLPLDSEHAALHQILDGRPRETVHRLVLTASGGPFRTTSRADLAHVTLEQALRHPTWDMGAKITIDSATLANKALEVIEARWLFDMEPERVGVLVHPQSIVHALVEMVDGTYLAQLGVTDMRAPIQYALSWPERWTMDLPPLDLAALGRLDFEEPDTERFPCLRLGREAALAGGTAPTVFNAANEEANAAFRRREVSFPGIPALIARALMEIPSKPQSGIDVVLEADRAARDLVRSAIREGRS